MDTMDTMTPALNWSQNGAKKRYLRLTGKLFEPQKSGCTATFYIVDRKSTRLNSSHT